ncbi:hypothetical protein [Dyella koreensis]|uniref:Chemotaxis methyl-accepting receptor HlyB-like 4HB MCP domain-containing protein n=1 Tax=Dyella koreensis TaxID=311235 RepID=A0ABW8JZC4_9GAMM
MHLEVTKVRLHSLKDFAKHYLMIVLSILTALGLEAWIEHSHRAHAADAASQRIEAEIRTNLSQTRTSLQQDTEQLKRLSEIRKAVIDHLKSGVADDTIKQRILALTKDNFDLKLRFPTLRHEAWDVSVANQAASWMEDDRLQRYAAAYANQRDSITSMTENTTILMSGSRLVDTVADLQTNEVQPREFLHVVSQMIAIQQQTVNALGSLEKQLMTALPNEGAADAKPSSAS